MLLTRSFPNLTVSLHKINICYLLILHIDCFSGALRASKMSLPVRLYDGSCGKEESWIYWKPGLQCCLLHHPAVKAVGPISQPP